MPARMIRFLGNELAAWQRSSEGVVSDRLMAFLPPRCHPEQGRLRSHRRISMCVSKLIVLTQLWCSSSEILRLVSLVQDDNEEYESIQACPLEDIF